ncbi:MAG: hypothetical protein DRJ13_15420, partial [Bacteroidetes bacterium]
EWAEGTGLYVESDGFLYSRGKPDQMVQFRADMSEMYKGYWTGIQIEGGNEHFSPSQVLYTHIASATAGLYLSDISMSEAISYNLIEECYWGVLTCGPRQSKISNNIVQNCGSWILTEYGFEAVGAGIEAYHAGFNGAEDPNSVIEIEFNTCDNNMYGIHVHGVSSEPNAGITFLSHNITSSSNIVQRQL